ncbi:MAG: hypothetical protein JSV82_09780 [Planctomycetota bacterium]|nr:MAG: hypothetical protein JSV82_09780 [Planctomycetota bacterium]
MRIIRFVPRLADADYVLKKYCRKNFKAPCSLEILYLPFVLFRYKIELISLFGKKKTEKGLFLVDLLQGIPVNIKKDTKFEFRDSNLQEEFRELLDSFLTEVKKNVVLLETEDIEQEQVLPIVLEEQVAIEKGKSLLMYDIMKLAGSLRYRRLDVIPLPGTKTLYYPYWLIYYRDRKGIMQFDVLDGLSGQKEGGQIIKSVKIGLVEKQRNSENLNLVKGASENWVREN